MPNQKDQNLILARDVLTLIPPNQQTSEKLKKQKELVELTELCIELGSPRLPATFRFCEPELILQETAAVNKNYKQVKKIAELSKFLGLKPPVAKAMAYCTVEAVKADDYSTVEKYIKKLNSISKDMPVIFNVCKNILSTGKWKNLHEELLTCMILNCPSEEIHLLSDYLKDFKKNLQPEEERRSNSPASQVTATITKLRDNLVDPLLLKQGKPTIIEDDELHLDPLYADISYFHRLTKFPDVVPEGERLIDLAKNWAPISATLAVATAALDDEGIRSWAKNEFLNTIAIGLRRIIEEGGNKLSIKVLEKLPTEVLLELGGDDFDEPLEEKPIVKEKPKPVEKEESKPSKKEEPKPVIKEKTKSVKNEEPKVKKVEQVGIPTVLEPEDEIEKKSVKISESVNKKEAIKVHEPEEKKEIVKTSESVEKEVHVETPESSEKKPIVKTPESTDKKPKRKPVVAKTPPKQPQSNKPEIEKVELEPPATRSSPQPEFGEPPSRERSFDDFSNDQNLVLRRRQKK